MSTPGEQPRKPFLTPGRFLLLATVLFLLWQCGESYRDYQVRAKVRRALEETAALRQAVDAQLEQKRPVRVAELPNPGPGVRRIEVTPEGEIVSHLAPEVTGEETTVSWKPLTLAGGQRVWDCGGKLPAKYHPATCRGPD